MEKKPRYQGVKFWARTLDDEYFNEYAELIEWLALSPEAEIEAYEGNEFIDQERLELDVARFRSEALHQGLTPNPKNERISMKDRIEVFTMEEAMFDCSVTRTGEFRTVKQKMEHSPDDDPARPATIEVVQERMVWKHADGREAESWEYICERPEEPSYNGRGKLACAHDFSGGLCAKCLAPETPEDAIRAENAYYNAEALAGLYSETLGYTPTLEQAIFEAWRSHRRQ